MSGGAGAQTALRAGADAVGSTDAILAGVLIIIGIAFSSRIAALFARVGSTVGMLVGMALGADGASIDNGS